MAGFYNSTFSHFQNRKLACKLCYKYKIGQKKIHAKAKTNYLALIKHKNLGCGFNSLATGMF
jgi:hypothetical protein